MLDARQIKRAEAVHGGFLYQHLYAAGCLFLAAKAGASAVVVERDEDIEIPTGGQRVYVQVKTCSTPIMPSDIDDVLRRFSQLRLEHVEGRREGGARFVIIVNSAPNPALSAQIQSNGIPDDVSIQRPGQTTANVPAVLPPAWCGVPEAVLWCIAAAETSPLALLTPEPRLEAGRPCAARCQRRGAKRR